jgi:hypothetical protein
MSMFAACELEEISESEMVLAVLGGLLNEVMDVYKYRSVSGLAIAF